MNGIMGKFQGIKVYKTTLPEYVNMRLYKDEENIYVIDGDMIYKNEIFAKWDGKYVNEWPVHQRAIFYKIPEVKIKDRGVEWTADIETKNSLPIGNFKSEDVDTTLAGVYETDYFGLMTDIDAFLKANS